MLEKSAAERRGFTGALHKDPPFEEGGDNPARTVADGPRWVSRSLLSGVLAQPKKPQPLWMPFVVVRGPL